MKKRSNHNKLIHQNNLHTSIQFDLDGFSFCVFNGDHEIVNITKYDFLESCSTPQELLSRVVEIFEKDSNLHYNFDKIRVIHRNHLNAFVPNQYFSERNLKDYLKFSVKTFSSDYVTFDELHVIEGKNVYIPFVNVNNYLLDHFGDFDFFHHKTVWIEKLLQNYVHEQKEVFVYLENHFLDIAVFNAKKLLLVNSFEIHSPEDFIYYLLFIYEQLQLDTNKIQTSLFGLINESTKEYELAYKYIRNIQIIESEESIFKTKDFNSTEFFFLT